MLLVLPLTVQLGGFCGGTSLQKSSIPSRVKSYTHARNWVLQILQNRFESEAKAGRPICAMEHFQHAMFCLLVLMCFGDKLDEDQIKGIKEVQRQMIVDFSKFNILNFWPGVTKISVPKPLEGVIFSFENAKMMF
ncbi:hypothetical protein OIU77_002662 [Salix suchowensis]|uniref:Uncharacterized protein n=1 Tax=Salix suchowensis TaxID=1278906 RepID=A0ABQ9AZ85_9ROSI|nr:hypothetical protein OIU77_002662 [Salix suchowensis]